MKGANGVVYHDPSSLDSGSVFFCGVFFVTVLGAGVAIGSDGSGSDLDASGAGLGFF